MKNYAVYVDKEIERVIDKSAKGVCWSGRGISNKRSTGEICEDQIIVAMMKWLSCCSCRQENIHISCNLHSIGLQWQ